MSKQLDELGGLPMFEVQKKERILNAHEDNHQEILALLRAEMAELSRREERAVDANDARSVLDSWGIDTGPWMGALFRSSEWENTGEITKSTAAGSHARILWRYLPTAEVIR